MVIMELPLDILDHIFSFLKFHPKALLACSKAHPILSQIVERYRFRHIIIHTGDTDFTHSFKPSDLRKYFTETPQISKHVAVLQIELDHPVRAMPYLEEIASLLPMLPVLECIMLQARYPWFTRSWNKHLPQAFRTAVEDCFNLPTLQEVHFSDISFPLSILDNHANLNYHSLSEFCTIETECLETTYPKIKTLALEGFIDGYSDLFLTWAKRHIGGLQSLKYDFSCHEMVLEIFKICSDTLEDLYLCFYRPERDSLINLTSLPHLRHLTIHAIFWHSGGSYLPRAVKTLKTAPMLQKLAIEIHVGPSMEDLNAIDLSPLRILTDSSLRFPCVDLYMYSGSKHLRVTYTTMHSLLAKHEGLMELIERGMLVVHPEEAAPALSRSYIATE